MSSHPSAERFRQVFNQVEPFIERRYGVAVRIGDVVNPFTGDLNGEEILVDHDQGPEDAVFVLVHLFGHTVQWNLSADARATERFTPGQATEAQLIQVGHYEREACRYSLQLFHEAQVRDLDAWFADFAACDFEYLVHFYRTGVKGEFRSFWKDHQPLLEPLRIPPFSPTRWVSRWQGVVI